MNYTKGEWYLEEETGLILSIPDGEANPIIIANAGKDGGITPKPLKELEANAYLIAAAPEMYEALKEIEHDLQLPELYLPSIPKAIHKLLAKAEGKIEEGN